MMYVINEFVLDNGKSPFAEWLKSVDKMDRLRVLQRVDRLAHGNFGDYKPVGDNVYELRFRYGGGYRVYYAFEDDKIVILLCGGNKGSQDRDIEQAKSYWRMHNERQNP